MSDAPADTASRVKSMTRLRRICVTRRSKGSADSAARLLDIGGQEGVKYRDGAEVVGHDPQRGTDWRTRREIYKSGRERAQRHKADKKRRKAEQKRTLNYYGGGLAWGFDPNAGMLGSGRAHPVAQDEAARTQANGRGAKELETPDLKPVRGHTWGVQYKKSSKDA